MPTDTESRALLAELIGHLTHANRPACRLYTHMAQQFGEDSVYTIRAESIMDSVQTQMIALAESLTMPDGEFDS